ATSGVPQIVADGRPSVWALLPVAPNPLRAAGRVTFDVPRHAQVRLALVDLAGREVDVLSNGELEPGRFSVQLDARSRPPGVYFLQLVSSGVRLQRAVVLIR
ncbi:MAG TPA: T9SS type A sorting domain-containing protein, partial [Candidatus Eisenbacteria bacterium]